MATKHMLLQGTPRGEGTTTRSTSWHAIYATATLLIQRPGHHLRSWVFPGHVDFYTRHILEVEAAYWTRLSSHSQR